MENCDFSVKIVNYSRETLSTGVLKLSLNRVVRTDGVWLNLKKRTKPPSKFQSIKHGRAHTAIFTMLPQQADGFCFSIPCVEIGSSKVGLKLSNINIFKGVQFNIASFDITAPMSFWWSGNIPNLDF